MEKILPAIFSLTMLVPNVIVWLIGIGLAVTRWRRHPRVSLFSLIAFVVMIVVTIAGRFLTAWLPLTMHERGWTSVQIGSIFAFIGAVTTLASACAWALVVWAIFAWRNDKPEFG